MSTEGLHLQGSVVLEVSWLLILFLVECCYLEEPKCTKLYIVMFLHWSHPLHGIIYFVKQCNCGSEMKSPFECTASKNTTLTEDIICAIHCSIRRSSRLLNFSANVGLFEFQYLFSNLTGLQTHHISLDKLSLTDNCLWEWKLWLIFIPSYKQYVTLQKGSAFDETTPP